MGVLVYPKGSALELLDGTLKLRHCTNLFTMHFHPWSLPRVGVGGGKRQFITPGLPIETGGSMVERVWLTKKTRPGVSLHSIRDQGRRWKRLRPPSSEGVGSEVGVPRFPNLGLGEVCTGGRLEPAFGGTGVGLLLAGQSSRRG